MIGNFLIFGKEVSSYAVCAFVGAMLTGTFAFIMSKRKGLDEVKMTFMLLFSVIGVFIGGHLLYGITNIDKLWLFGKIKNFNGFITVFSLVFGGQVFYGGLFGGIAVASIFAKITRLENFSSYADIMAVGVPFFHFFGRIGCFMGGCCYGIESDFGYTTYNGLISSANGVNRFPVQLFEAGFCLLLSFFMFRLLKSEKLKDRLFYIYLFIYAIGRFILEFFRGDSYRGFLFGLSTSQIISILIIILISVFYIISKKNKSSHKFSP